MAHAGGESGVAVACGRKKSGSDPRWMEGRANMEAAAPASKQIGSALFWRVFALVNLVTVAWVIWVIWQLNPRPVVHEFVLRKPAPPAYSRSQRTVSGAIPAVAAPRTPGAAPVAPAAGAEIPIPRRAPMSPLKLETEIKAAPK